MTEGRVDSASASSELNIRVQRQEAELLSLQVRTLHTRPPARDRLLNRRVVDDGM